MTTLTRAVVEKVARLARLDVSEEDLTVHVKNLNNILNFVEQLNATKIKDIEPMAHPLDIPQPLRKDEITESDQRELYQSIAPMMENGRPAVKAGFYLVPLVIE